MRKKVRCRFCGTVLTNEKCYIARGKKLEGLTAAFSSSEEPTLYDAVDCPRCGKQEIVGIREREFTIVILKEEEDAGDSNNSDNMRNIGDDLMD